MKERTLAHIDRGERFPTRRTPPQRPYDIGWNREQELDYIRMRESNLYAIVWQASHYHPNYIKAFDHVSRWRNVRRKQWDCLTRGRVNEPNEDRLARLRRYEEEEVQWPEHQITIYGAWRLNFLESIGYNRMTDERKREWERQREAMADQLLE